MMRQKIRISYALEGRFSSGEMCVCVFAGCVCVNNNNVNEMTERSLLFRVFSHPRALPQWPSCDLHKKPNKLKWNTKMLAVPADKRKKKTRENIYMKGVTETE